MIYLKNKNLTIMKKKYSPEFSLYLFIYLFARIHIFRGKQQFYNYSLTLKQTSMFPMGL